jgi:hypothetical protein
MPDRPGSIHSVTINRAPVLTLWAAVVAERLGYDRDEAATLGRAVAGLNAAAKARALGIARAREKPAAAGRSVEPAGATAVPLCGRMIPVVRTADGLRATSDGRPGDPRSVHRYLEKNFGDALESVRDAMRGLARSRSKEELAEEAFRLYEEFRPNVPRGTRGWGARGVLDLARIRTLAERG